MTPVSIPPDPYQVALKELRDAKEEIRLLTASVERLNRAQKFLNLQLDHAQKRYYEEQTQGDQISIASTRARYLAFRDACRELDESAKEIKP